MEHFNHPSRSDHGQNVSNSLDLDFALNDGSVKYPSVDDCNPHVLELENTTLDVPFPTPPRTSDFHGFPTTATGLSPPPKPPRGPRPAPPSSSSTLDHSLLTNPTNYSGRHSYPYLSSISPPLPGASLNDTEALPLSTSVFAVDSSPPFARSVRTSISTDSHVSIPDDNNNAVQDQNSDPWTATYSPEPVTNQELTLIEVPASSASTPPDSTSVYLPCNVSRNLAQAQDILDQSPVAPSPSIPPSESKAEPVPFNVLYAATRKVAESRGPSRSQHNDQLEQLRKLVEDALGEHDSNGIPESAVVAPSLPPPPFVASSPPPRSPPAKLRLSKSKPKSSPIESSILAESVTWEKVEGIRDEWQELRNPKEEVLAMSESEDSEDALDQCDVDVDEEDEIGWEASRKLRGVGMVFGEDGGGSGSVLGFLPSVERRRILNAAASSGDGNATPRGKRTPTTSMIQKSTPSIPTVTTITASGATSQIPTSKKQPPPSQSDVRSRGCAYEAYATRPAVTVPQAKLTTKQQQLVAELQRARSGAGIATQPMHVSSIAADW